MEIVAQLRIARKSFGFGEAARCVSEHHTANLVELAFRTRASDMLVRENHT